MMENSATYYNRMQKSVMDKLWFLDKLPDESCVIVDYGCADGFMIQKCRSIMPQHVNYGYDEGKNFQYPTWEEIKKWKRGSKQPSVLILSSVLHEIYSFKDDEWITQFWKEAKEFDYICIRDFCFQYAPANYNPELGGTTECERMMKLQYPDNSENESKEHYFSVPWEKIESIFSKKNRFRKMYSRNYVLWFQKMVKTRTRD